MTPNGSSTSLTREDVLARDWYFTQPACGSLVHGCGLYPPRPCRPCLKTPGHNDQHDPGYFPEQDEIRRLFLAEIDRRQAEERG